MRAPALRVLRAAAAAALLTQPPIARCLAEDARGEPSVLVQTAALVQGSLPQSVTSYGIATANPAAQHSVVARIAAIVTRLYVRSGEPIHAGAPLVELTPTPSTRAAYSTALAAQREAADSLARTHRLLNDSLATAQQLAAAQTGDAEARAALHALEVQGAGGPAVLRAPFAAVVTAVTTASNSIVTEGAPLIELAQSNGLRLLAGVVPAQAVSIKTGDAVRIEAVGGRHTFDGHVVLRGSLVDAASGLISVEILIPENSLLPGEMARASIITGQASGFVVPHAAILVNEEGNAYLVQPQGGAAHLVPVQILATADGKDVVSGSLDVSAPVIVSGNHQLQNGMKVRYRNGDAGTRP